MISSQFNHEKFQIFFFIFLSQKVAPYDTIAFGCGLIFFLYYYVVYVCGIIFSFHQKSDAKILSINDIVIKCSFKLKYFRLLKFSRLLSNV